MRRSCLLLLLAAAALFALLLFGLWGEYRDPRSQEFIRWWRASEQERYSLITVQREACPGAPFILPSDGYIGLLYGDPRGPYSAANPHQGIDIFSNTDPGVTPVYAAYDGYLTREPEWRSSLIIRVPEDPLNTEQQIWLYHTHLADEEGNDYIVSAFPPGTSEQFVTQGTLLDYTGNYNGGSLRDVWVHLHFSIVKDDGNGRYRNELEFENTIDPSPYIGMSLNHKCTPAATGCTVDSTCSAEDNSS